MFLEKSASLEVSQHENKCKFQDTETVHVYIEAATIFFFRMNVKTRNIPLNFAKSSRNTYLFFVTENFVNDIETKNYYL